MSARLAACGWLLLVIGAVSPALAHEATIVIRAGHLVDTELGRMVGPQMILVQDGHIAGVGPQIAVPAGAKVVDLSAYTVLPGLIDAHTHLTIAGAASVEHGTLMDDEGRALMKQHGT